MYTQILTGNCVGMRICSSVSVRLLVICRAIIGRKLLDSVPYCSVAFDFEAGSPWLDTFAWEFIAQAKFIMFIVTRP